MGVLDDSSIFAAVIQHGGFSHAAKALGLSNGMISRRIIALEKELGVSLITRTTRRIQLTPEGQVFWQHAQRIQLELTDAYAALKNNSIKGTIRVSAPRYLGKHHLTPLIVKFLQQYEDIKIDLILCNKQVDIIQDKIDLAIRGAGYIAKEQLTNSSMRMRILSKEKIGLYASKEYLVRFGVPKHPNDLQQHTIIDFQNTEEWQYSYKNKLMRVNIKPKLFCNDIESNIKACEAGFGIAKFTTNNVRTALQRKLIQPILKQYDWGRYNLHIVYPQQRNLPQRTRLLFDYIFEYFKSQNTSDFT